MRVSRIVLLLVALLAGGLAAFLATRGGPPPEAPATPEVVQEARAQVLVARDHIGLGQRLRPENVQWQDWPEGAVRPEYITASAAPDAIKQMDGAIARFEIFPGEPIQQAKLVNSDQGYLSAVLDKGMRGVSLSVQADSASGGFIVPNDHVDVVLTRSANGSEISQTVLSNVRVLAINTRLGETGKTGAPADAANPDNADPKSQVFSNTAIATLELDPGQAETVINAGQLGKLSLVLRSIADFDAPANGPADQRSNAPIRVIRYGQEVSVTATVAPPAGGSGITQPVRITGGGAAPNPNDTPS